MRVVTDDGRFGFILNPVTGDMYRFQIIVDGRTIGDDEPCILGSAMYRLRHLRPLGDQRLAHPSDDPDAVSSVLRCDEELHDAATLSMAESLDRWLVHGYIYQKRVVMLAQEYESGALAGPIFVSVVDEAEYNLIVHALHSYWTKARSDQPGRPPQ